MTPSIWHARFKVEWAKKHLDDLHTLVRVLEGTGGKRISAYEDVERNQYVIRTRHLPEPDFYRLVLTAGDFVSSLRASLDHLAWQLALLTTSKPVSDLSFPIFEKNTVDTQMRLAKVTFGIPEPAVAVIKSLQPYHAGDEYKSTHLWRLNKLWNIDKHRHLAGFREMPNTWEINFQGIQGMGEIPIETEQIGNLSILRLPLTIKDEVKFNPDVRVDFEINEASEGIVLGYTALHQIYEFVAETVFPAFAGFFPSQQGMERMPQPIQF